VERYEMNDEWVAGVVAASAHFEVAFAARWMGWVPFPAESEGLVVTARETVWKGFTEKGLQ
jgi:hypothetical protein